MHTPLLTGTAWRARIAAFVVLVANVVSAAIDPALQLQLGNPTGATADENDHNRYLVQRPQYALDFNDNQGVPNWVSWNITTADFGSSGRTNNFLPDPAFPPTFYAVVTSDYTGSGFDRGHMCPSADRTITRTDNEATFLMSNILPQAPDNNQGVWASFETYCRSLASAGNEILVLSGGSIYSGFRIPSGKAAIPGYTWKIAVVVPLGPGSAVSRIDAATRIITIKVPNTAGVRSTPWQNFVTSVAQIEADTGYTFLTELPAPIASVLRTVVDSRSTAGAPSIVTHPSAQTAVVGGSATFRVTAAGDAPLSYQWVFNDDDIPGATGSTLTLDALQASQAGTYHVVVSNPAGTAISNTAALIVNPASSSTLAWNFGPSGSPSPLPTSSLPDISGGPLTQGNNNGTTPLLTTTSVSSGYPGVSGAFNAGAAARIGPLNQAAGGSAYFEFAVSPASGKRLVVTGIGFGVRSTGTGPQAYRVYTNLDAFAAPVAEGSIPNNSNWAFATPAFAIVTGEPGAPITFRIYGYNGTGSPGANTANWRIDDLKVTAAIEPEPAIAPTIVLSPADQTAVVGDTVTFTVSASGTPPLAYAWRKNGLPIAGNETATAASLVLSQVATSDAGSYDCVVSNSAGATIGGPASLMVSQAEALLFISGVGATYDGAAHAVQVATQPAGLAVDVTYNGSPTPPTAAGSYEVVATVVDADYVGTAKADLTIAKATASLTLGELAPWYDGTAKAVSAATNPAGLNVRIAYSGSPTPPSFPAAYTVTATIEDANYVGSVADTLIISTALLVRHAPTLNGAVDGSLQVTLPESVTLNGSAWLSGDLLVPGTPSVQWRQPGLGGIRNASGASSPRDHTITVNGHAVLRRVIRRVDPSDLPVVDTPPTSLGTRDVQLNSHEDTTGDFATLRDLAVNGSGLEFAIPPGTYGSFTVNGNNTLVLGTAGLTEPAVYNLRSLALNSGARIRIVGPVVVTLAETVVINGAGGIFAGTEWLLVNVTGPGVTLNSQATLEGFVVVPAGVITLNGSSTLIGGLAADRLIVNGGALIRSNP